MREACLHADVADSPPPSRDPSTVRRAACTPHWYTPRSVPTPFGTRQLDGGSVAPEKLLQRLEWEKRVTQENLEVIRERLVALEERAAALAITRRTLTDLLGAEPAPGELPICASSDDDKGPSAAGTSASPHQEERATPPGLGETEGICQPPDRDSGGQRGSADAGPRSHHRPRSEKSESFAGGGHPQGVPQTRGFWLPESARVRRVHWP